MVKFKNTITITGLNDEEVLKSRSKHGTNELPPPEIESFWDKLKENFEDPIIRILLVALGITLGLALLGYADWVEGLGIFIAVFLATFVSTWSEYKNEYVLLHLRGNHILTCFKIQELIQNSSRASFANAEQRFQKR